jgi:hypothetical protein
MKIENRLSHEVIVFDRKDVTFSNAHKCFLLKKPSVVPVRKFPASAYPTPRVHLDATMVEEIDGVILREEIPGRPLNVPSVSADTLFIVSRRFAEAALLFGRKDFLFPDGMVRDAEDKPLGCVALGRPITASLA